MKLLQKIILLLLLSACSDNQPELPEDQDSNDQKPPDTENPIDFNLGISFPPVADQNQRDFTSPLLEDLNVNIIRIGERWSNREPSQGEFNWGPLDDRLNWANENDIEVLLTIQSDGPDWACSNLQNTNSCVFNNNEQFKNYVELLLQRYPNMISKIQFGNEWMSDFWYIGTAQEFVEVNNIVYNAIQEFSPQTEMVLGGFTTISLRFLSACDGRIDSFLDENGNVLDREFFDSVCGSSEVQTVSDRIDFVINNALYNEVDIHLYDDPENWDIYFGYIESKVNTPIIITEFGGPNTNFEPTDEAYQAERLEDYIRAIDSLDVSEAYFFKLVEGTTNNEIHSKSGLISNPSLARKQSYFKFRELNEK